MILLSQVGGLSLLLLQINTQILSNHAFLSNTPITTQRPAIIPQHITSLGSSTLPKEESTTKISSSSSTPQPPNKNDKNDDNEEKNLSFGERMQNSGIASAAALATAAVNSAVAMKTLEAPTVSKSYISLDKSSTALDEDGLPLTYDADAINAYWTRERGALRQRWNTFVSKAVPFLTKLVTLFITEGEINERHVPGLARRAREDIQDLGPTFIKAGQMMSVRPDVLPQAALDELAALQDGVIPFETSVAVEVIERELGAPLGEYFGSISEEPVAAASLAQVYRATLRDGVTEVAIKVQRPQILSTVSKDLYVLRRAAEVFQGLVERFAPQQKTDYVALLNEWAIGFYTELDFRNEAKNQNELRDLLVNSGVKGVTVPKVYDELTTRRVLVSEWMNGRKLSECTPDQIKEVTTFAQEAFLVQLFDAGFFHADPHPGNILMLNDPDSDGRPQIALIDCGLMARIGRDDRDLMISAVIHLANKDYASLVDDFIKLEILPRDSDRATIVPLMDKALSPYVKGGGAKKYEEELKKLYGMEDGSAQATVGGFQAMTQDALTVLNDVPFSIPPYFAILGRAIVTLEGVALSGDESYGIVMESYPFIARKLMRDDRPEIQGALQEVLFAKSTNGETTGVKLTRLLALLNNAAGSVGTQDGSAFVDLDAIPEDGISLGQGLKYLMGENAESLRRLLETEVDNAVDIITRQILRKGVAEVVMSLSPQQLLRGPFSVLGRSLGSIVPKLDDVPLPLLLPPPSTTTPLPASVGLLTLKDFVTLVAPPLDQSEEIYAIGIAEAATEFFGENAAAFVRGEGVAGPTTARLLLEGVRNGYFGELFSSSGGGGGVSNAAVNQIVEGVGGVLEQVLSRGGPAGTGAAGAQQALSVLQDLDEGERERFDGIVRELVRRSVARATERLADVPRVL